LAACAAALAELARAEGVAAQALGVAMAGLANVRIPSVPTVTLPSASLPSAGSSSGSGSNKAAIAADQVAVLEARQRVRQAEANLASATLTSPVDGVVGSLSLIAGASSAGAGVLILGEGAAIADVEVPLGIRQALAQGASVTVTPVGSLSGLSGRIESINVLATEGTTGSGSTYATRVVIDDPSGRLLSGSTADVAFTLHVVANVLTVPASALTPVSEDAATVAVVTSSDAEQTETLTVRTGAIGGGLAEITEGLTPGQLVVLADRNEPLPGFDFGEGPPGSRQDEARSSPASGTPR
jgi:multidrug efflux pump subunit AcrA (membrane-fusion protein)